MTIYGWLIFAPWLALVAYWCLSGAPVRRSPGGRWMWWREIAVRLGFFALVVLALRVAAAAHALPNAGLHALNTSLLLGLTGFVLCVTGIGLAIMARVDLERNRSMSDSIGKPTLVTTGPYAVVRHPFYGGMLLALAGSAIGQSVFWLVPLIVYGPVFILSARREEKLLIGQFPEQYGAYMKRTRVLLPYLL